jgi:hypothetical protein
MARFRCRACNQEGTFEYEAGRHACPRCGSPDVQFALRVDEMPDELLGEPGANPTGSWAKPAPDGEHRSPSLTSNSATSPPGGMFPPTTGRRFYRHRLSHLGDSPVPDVKYPQQRGMSELG